MTGARACPDSTRARSRCRIWARSSRRRSCAAAGTARARRLRARRAARRRISLELADVELVALDSDEARLARVRENLARLAPRRRRACEVVAGDAGAPAAWWDGRPFDRILADVPCTATGVVAPSSRRQMAAPRSRYRELRAAAGAAPRRAVDVPRARRAACSTRRARSSRRKTRRRSRRSSRATPMRCAKPSPFAPEVARRGAQLLPSLPARATIKTDIFTRCCASLTGMRRGADSARPTPTASRHRVRRPARRNAPAIRSHPSARLRCHARAVDRAARFVAGVRAVAAFRPAARADTIAVKSAELRADEDAYVLSAEFELAFNPTLEEALQKGVPLYFVFEFELMRPRWYWVDDKVLSSDDAIPRLVQRADAAVPRRERPPRPDVRRRWTRSSASCRASRRAQVARRDQLVKGTRYEAAVRLRLDVNAAAEAVPGERARLARLDAAIGMASLELHAVSGLLPSRADALAAARARVPRRRSRCSCSRRRRRTPSSSRSRYDTAARAERRARRAADAARRRAALAAVAASAQAACSARGSRCGSCCCSRWSRCCRARSSTRCRCSSSAAASRAGSTCASIARSKAASTSAATRSTIC